MSTKSKNYSAIHKWLSAYYGQPKQCQFCKTTKAKKYEWANISKKYKRKITDYLRLCVKCHDLFDKKPLKYCKCGKVYYGKNLCRNHYYEKYRVSKQKKYYQKIVKVKRKNPIYSLKLKKYYKKWKQNKK